MPQLRPDGREVLACKAATVSVRRELSSRSSSKWLGEEVQVFSSCTAATDWGVAATIVSAMAAILARWGEQQIAKPAGGPWGQPAYDVVIAPEVTSVSLCVITSGSRLWDASVGED
ncbi:hypothetical protein HPB50_011111 [Hyalomma asiaticum]|uniref:Uncharacterized protein n=1 Tax=Hyalomma asiaticum TaxID=266040 RepID=A0ACB7SII6_HYAAI|nr:hypothetical protein HPB50_011111 [Hyalomma asiaticum]